MLSGAVIYPLPSRQLRAGYRVTDAEAVSMARYIVKNDGLFLGSSSACNLVAAVRIAKSLGRQSGCRIVTIL
jgi:cysteine synthase